MNQNVVLAGMGLLLSSITFFVYDAISDVAAHALDSLPYSGSDLTHLIFEVSAVFGLAYAVVTLRGHHNVLRAEAESSKDTLHMLRGNFDDVLQRKFLDWRLTEAERDVTLLIIRGMSVAEIASARNTALGTIKTQSTSIFRKIGVRSKTELMCAIIDEFLDL